MKIRYRGFEIDCRREKSLAGSSMLYFHVIREDDEWVMIDAFEDSDEKVSDMVNILKSDVDNYYENPEDWEDE